MLMEAQKMKTKLFTEGEWNFLARFVGYYRGGNKVKGGYNFYWTGKNEEAFETCCRDRIKEILKEEKEHPQPIQMNNHLGVQLFENDNLQIGGTFYDEDEDEEYQPLI